MLPHLMHTPLSFHSIPSPFSFSPCPHIHKCTHTHDYTQSGETALHDAVNQGHEDVIDILLEAKIDPDVADKVSHMRLTVPNMKYHLQHTAQYMCPLIDYDVLCDKLCPIGRRSLLLVFNAIFIAVLVVSAGFSC